MPETWYYWQATWQNYMIKAAHLLHESRAYTSSCGQNIVHRGSIRPVPDELPRCRRCLRRRAALEK